MADFARVESIDAIREFRAALWKFAEVAQVALGDAESELSRTLTWLETEQTSYWTGQVRKRTETVGRAADKLREKRLFKDASGRIPSAVDEEKALKLAKAKLAEAEEKVLAVRKNIRVIQKAMHDYKGTVQGFGTAVAHDLPLSVARLDKLSELLGQYVNMQLPSTGPEESAAPTLAGGMGRLGGGPAGDAGSAAAPPADELPDFPTFQPPAVVLVHTHRPTGLTLAADGKTPAEDGNQYRRFASAAEAEQYAKLKVDSMPLIEFAVYAADRARVLTVNGAET